jgi:polyisoprenoid-binding protein YceI
MKKLLTFAVAGLFALASFAGNGEGEKEKYNAVAGKSTIFWTGKKVTGQHTGTLLLKEGSIDVENGVPVGASFKLDMNSIVCTDLTDADLNKKLVGHLKSDDFFAVAKFPEGEFVATSFTPIEQDGERSPNYLVKGNLTLKGISHPIEFPALVVIKDGKIVSNGELVIDRSKWDIRYGSGSFFEGLGDNLIYDEIQLNFVMAAQR